MTSFTIERADGERRVLGGYRYREPSEDARRFASTKVGRRSFPPKVDLRPYMTAVENQGQTNSCAANAAAGAYEYLMKRHQGDDAYDVSRMFIYYNARAADGEEIEDEGSVLQSVIASLEENGACSEETWPFDEELVNDEPDETSFEEAAGFLIGGCELVETELDGWKAALAEGNPIIFGIKLWGSFDQQRKPGLVPAPSPAEAGREGHGGHAMLCVGYSDADKVFIVRNSWGAEWGDQGYCYMPYSYVMDPDQNFGDSWIITSLEVLDEDEVGWGDDESVLTEVSDFLGEMSEDDYRALLDAMGEHPLERRMALLFLMVIGADGDIDEAELETAAEHLQPLLDALGIRMRPEKLLKRTVDFLDPDLFEETVTLFAEQLPTEVLASVAAQLEEAAAADEEEDEMAAEELDVLDAIVSAWQLEEELEEGEEEEQSEERRGLFEEVVDAVVDVIDDALDEDEDEDEEDEEEEEEEEE
jgi:hypothetical protein